jgi:hypothetical protein
MLEGWEWIFIFGFAAMVMVVVLVIAVLHYSTKQKANTPQSYAPQQYSPQYNQPANKICLQCGRSNVGDANFCANCGKQL